MWFWSNGGNSKNFTEEEEESEKTLTCLKEVSEINTTQDQMIEILKEINASLKDIAETQKAILEEIRCHKS